MAFSGSIPQLAKILAADPRFGPAFLYLDRCLAPGSEEAQRLRDLAAAAVPEVRLEAAAGVPSLVRKAVIKVPVAPTSNPG
jgi:hypothetical protein